MNLHTQQKLGAIALILGSVLLTAYAIAIPLLLPIQNNPHDFILRITSAHWIWISSLALLGILFTIFGYTAVYSRMRRQAGLLGFMGYIFVMLAYILQASKVTWEIFLFPIIANNPASVFLFSDSVIRNNPLFMTFRTLAEISIFLGIILFCAALYRAAEFPKSAALLIFIGALVYAIGPFFSIIIGIAGIITLSLGSTLLGRSLWQSQTDAG
ncbi:MAG: hypothetical protein HY080_03505 [Gammaproteobacteria bacterium]|nr:hypothetical protein [Gammaproteobacteria bacterium]